MKRQAAILGIWIDERRPLLVHMGPYQEYGVLGVHGVPDVHGVLQLEVCLVMSHNPNHVQIVKKNIENTLEVFGLVPNYDFKFLAPTSRGVEMLLDEE